ncbi:MAG: prolyl oligopeptidase family serine peptidase, partial [Candidatus Sumerlaeota bacterium]
YQPKRAGKYAEELSPQHHLDKKMPAILLFHGDADKTVPQSQSLSLRDKLIAGKNDVEFVNVPGGEHSFTTNLPEWKTKQRDLMKEFLTKRGLISGADAKQDEKVETKSP